MNVYFQGSWRMDWGLGNPNKTAVLIALIMLLVWALAFVWKQGFWVSLTLTVVLGWCLVQTYSRGGMVAALIGFGILIGTAPRPWRRSRWIAVFIALWILGGFILYSKAQLRYEQGLFTEDQSVGNRLIIWKHVPEMLWAAPWGWGLGNGGNAYTLWYQPLDQSVPYLNLINSHFTWMVELGWIGSVIYLFAWFVTLRLTIPLKDSILGWLPLSIWVGLALGASFSAVAESPWMWLVPGLAILFSLGERTFKKVWPKPSYYLKSAAFSLATVSVLLVIGYLTTTLPIFRSGNLVICYGKGPRTVAFVDRHVLGPLFGHTFRKHFTELNGESWLFVESGSLPPALNFDDTVWITGKLGWPRDQMIAWIQPVKTIALINPEFSPDEIQLPPNEMQKTKVFVGEYCEIPSRSLWSETGLKNIQIEGVGAFVPDWPTIVPNLEK